MKGIVFSELIAMAEELLGEEAVDDVLTGSDLASGGAYTSVGNYPCGELMTLVAAFSARGAIPAADLQRRFGRWMQGRFHAGYPLFFADKPDALAMLEAIEGEVHAEVRKLYPDAELPRFDSRRLPGEEGLELVYHSPRPLGDFCHGLIEACIAHFGRPARIDRRDLPAPEGMSIRFTIRMAG
ncbi:MAG: heme NO-binding domain-containing protein [Paracoccus sp. (in: a-proteobacteria)]